MMQIIYFSSVIYGVGNGCFLAVDMALAMDVLPNKENSAKVKKLLSECDNIFGFEMDIPT
jgi:hypothetical protein